MPMKNLKVTHKPINKIPVPASIYNTVNLIPREFFLEFILNVMDLQNGQPEPNFQNYTRSVKHAINETPLFPLYLEIIMNAKPLFECICEL